MPQYLDHNQPFLLENGAVLPGLRIAYHTFGRPDASWSNVVWVCHALTANSDVTEWWSGLFGDGCLFNPQEHYIVCANMIGSCYGSTHPLSVNPETGEPWYHDFPDITIRDMVNAHRLLQHHLGIPEIAVLIGASMGGQQALEWSLTDPDSIRQLVLIATNAQHSPWGIAFNASQRLAITTDPTWSQRHAEAGREGLKTARSIALLSYRNYHAYGASQQETDDTIPEVYRAASYQQYQGEKLAQRFDAFSYHLLSRAMDSHHIGRHRGPLEAVLQTVKAATTVIGITSDILFPVEEQAFLHRCIPHARFYTIDSGFGHDGFLIETKKLTDILNNTISWKTNSPSVSLASAV